MSGGCIAKHEFLEQNELNYTAGSTYSQLLLLLSAATAPTAAATAAPQ
jgi:hypothetical protein